MDICAIVVTFRAFDDLLNCVTAILQQSLAPSAIIIVDNDETAKSRSAVEGLGFTLESYTGTSTLFSSSSAPVIYYFYPGYNSGGAGGFFCGLKLATSLGYHWFWLMDDDGEPDNDALSELRAALFSNPGRHIFNSLVVDKDRPHLLSSQLNGQKTRQGFTRLAVSGCVDGSIRAFNGTFFSRSVLSDNVWPNPDFFLWGDEVDFCKRAMAKGYTLTTVVASIHKHPSHEWKVAKLFNRFNFAHVDDPFLNYVKARNYAHLRGKAKPWDDVKDLIKATLFYLVQRKADITGFYSFTKGFLDGKANNFRKTSFSSARLDEALHAICDASK